MKCVNCGHELNVKDRFCRECGMRLTTEAQNESNYLEEMRQIAREQSANQMSPDKFEEYDLKTPLGLLRAQLEMLVLIYRRVEKLEDNGRQRVRVIDFDMPFWSLVNFEFKVFCVSLFYLSVFSCLVLTLFYLFFKDISLPFLKGLY